MYLELDLCKYHKEEEFVDNLFTGLDNDIDSFVVPNNYLAKARDLLPTSSMVSCPIDSPHGLSDCKVRQHAIITAAKKGANAIDLYVNPIHVANKNEDKLEDDINIQMEICGDYGLIHRIVLEYRTYDYRTIKLVLGILNACGVEYAIPSSGTMLDDPFDNIVICAAMEIDYNLKAIYNAELWLDNQYELIRTNKIFGIRIRSMSTFSLLERCKI